MVNNTNNKEFWNNYVDYFINKIEEANSENETVDKTANDRVYNEYFKKLAVKKDDKFLDFGCGFCRLFPIYRAGVHSDESEMGYYGIDVSRRELEEAQKRYDSLKIDQTLFEYDGMNIPFSNDYFNKIMCWGVFDACNQEIIIRELFRVLKPGGILFITGKNDSYFEDDDAAKIAEANAREKGHPNYFTNVHDLTDQLTEHGVHLLETYYFLRRGDFTNNCPYRGGGGTAGDIL